MKAVYALYPDGHAAQQAVDALRQAGVADDDITVISGQPMEHHEFGHIGAKSKMWWIACGGGLLGMGTGFGLSWITETSWPINVGGMPIFAWWPNLIITFELTMLGAILSTVVTLLVTAALPSSRNRLYDPEVTTANKILVGVEGGPAESKAEALGQALRLTPDTAIRTRD
jgi:hypothetical protein